MLLSIIIPAKNEEKRIVPTLLSVDEYMRKQTYEYEIIVVNDGSSDSTAEVVKGFIPIIPRLSLIDNKINHGKGWAVRQGMLKAQGKYRLFMDADNSTKINNLDTFLPYFDHGFDVIVSSRRVPGAVLEVPQALIRDFLGGVFRLLVHSVVSVGVRDTQNGFKLFRDTAAEAVFRRQRINRWAFDVELLAIARVHGFKIKELPIHWVNDGRSNVTLKGMIHMLFEVFEVRLNLWLGKYKKLPPVA